MFRAAISGLCVAHVFGTGEQGALMQSQANTEDLDAILLANTDSLDTPRLSKHHPSHGSHERSRQKLTELQSNAQMLEQKYRAILHAKVEKVAAVSSTNNVHVIKRGAHEFVPKADLFDPVDTLLQQMMETLNSEKALNQDLIDAQEAVLDQCNQVRHDEFDLPRYMDYYFYAATMLHICDNHNICYDAAHADWVILRDHTKILEQSQKLIWKVLKKASCYVERIRKNEPSQSDIQECVDLDITTDHLTIEYEEVTKDACDICDVKSDLGIKETDVAIDEWWEHVRSHNRIKTNRDPKEGIVNAVKIMYEMLEKKGLIDQQETEQQVVHDQNVKVAECNRIKEQTWIDENTDQLESDMTTARGAHTDCRTGEIVELTDMNLKCEDFQATRSSCNWPYWFDDHGGNATLQATITKGKDCHAAIVATNPISRGCDAKQDVFEDEFCEYFASKNKTCWDHTKCYDARTQERAEEIEFVKKREHSLKLQHRLLKINQCFIALMQGAEDAEAAQELEAEKMKECSDADYDLSHLDIDYPEAEVKGDCDTSDIVNYPGEGEWEAAEFGKSPFTDKYNSMKGIDSCSFHSTSLLIQKMKVSRSKSMRSP